MRHFRAHDWRASLCHLDPPADAHRVKKWGRLLVVRAHLRAPNVGPNIYATYRATLSSLYDLRRGLSKYAVATPIDKGPVESHQPVEHQTVTELCQIQQSSCLQLCCSCAAAIRDCHA